jgi:hypothetical protein
VSSIRLGVAHLSAERALSHSLRCALLMCSFAGSFREIKKPDLPNIARQRVNARLFQTENQPSGGRAPSRMALADRARFRKNVTGTFHDQFGAIDHDPYRNGTKI